MHLLIEKEENRSSFSARILFLIRGKTRSEEEEEVKTRALAN